MRQGGGQNDRPGLVAVITGASRGLGLGMAEAFAAEGIRLGLCARRRPEPPAGREALTASVDVTDAEAVDSFGREVVGRFGRIDLWVNNAGVLDPIGPLADARSEDLRRHLDVNILGTMHGSATFARHVRTRPGGGVLVNLSSGAATRPYEGWAAYCASKAAVEMLTAVIAREEQTSGLRAVALAPGVMDTDMQAAIRATPDTVFPAVGRFRQIDRDGAFNSPEWVARAILGHVVDDSEPPRTDEGLESVRFRVPDQP